MFVTRANPLQQLPSFSELMLSIALQPPLPQQTPFGPMGMPPEVSEPQLVYTPRPTLTLQPGAMRHTPLPACFDPGMSPIDPAGLESLLPLLVNEHRISPAWPELTNTSSVDSNSPGTEQSVSPVSGTAAKRKHACKTCGRLFTTLGHLARHNRTHTGERKHMCPWPQCEARFARQDNCMQHYKTHMNGKGKRSRLRR